MWPLAAVNFESWELFDRGQILWDQARNRRSLSLFNMRKVRRGRQTHFSIHQKQLLAGWSPQLSPAWSDKYQEGWFQTDKNCESFHETKRFPDREEKIINLINSPFVIKIKRNNKRIKQTEACRKISLTEFWKMFSFNWRFKYIVNIVKIPYPFLYKSYKNPSKYLCKTLKDKNVITSFESIQYVFFLSCWDTEVFSLI